MSEEKLSERIDALEAKLMFQEDTIEVLNQTITMQWQQIDTLKRQLKQLNERVREAEANTPKPTNERPPHY
jgi:SlyX protein